MSTDEEVEPTHMWEVMISTVANGRRASYPNVTLHVVARTVDRCIVLAREQHPDARFHKIERRNRISGGGVLIDPEVAR